MSRFSAIIACIFLDSAVYAGPQLGDDGLHKTDWFHDTFLDLPEDLEDAAAEGKRLVLFVEQRGCIYCTKMHNEVYVVPEIEAHLSDDFYAVQLNMFGDREVIDFDGEVLSEKQIVRKWRVMFTPTVMFYGDSVPEGENGGTGWVATMPGAFGPRMTRHMMEWVLAEGYLGDENFQKYHARMLGEGG